MCKKLIRWFDRFRQDNRWHNVAEDGKPREDMDCWVVIDFFCDGIYDYAVGYVSPYTHEWRIQDKGADLRFQNVVAWRYVQEYKG